MKKLSILTISFITTIFYITGISLFAQEQPKWVSTETQKRVAVIEEFTGMYCQWCPDGHKIANLLAINYPKRVIIINNHCTNYATPQRPTDPDLRTQEGNTIAASAGISGLPAGSVNRTGNPWAKMRDKWQAEVQNIVNQQSIVNIYVKPDINFETRALTVEVEVYYTGNSNAEENYLTVMLLQDNILGYQSNMGINPDYIDREGYYRHMHALREVISAGGAWGDTIKTTKTGHYEYKRYELTLPKSIQNIDLVLEDLRVVAFVAESKANIYTGYEAIIEVPTNLKTDLSITDISEYPQNIKLAPYNPKVNITNNEDITITKFAVNLYINNNLFDTKIFNGNLASGETTTIDFGKFMPGEGGNFTTKFEIDNISSEENNNMIDINKLDNKCLYAYFGLLEKIIDTIDIGFDTFTPNFYFDVTQNKKITLFSTGQEIGANNSKVALLFYLHDSWGVKGKPAYVVFGEVNCEENKNKVLSYYYAYSDGGFNKTAPNINVDISNDWGETWETISSTTCTQTGVPSNPNNIYTPKSSEYKKVEINLKEYITGNCIIRVGGIPGTGGNALFIDDISLSNDNGNIEEEKTVEVTIFPNPTTNTIYINNVSLLNMDYEIYDNTGKLIMKDNNNNNSINVEQLTSGRYTLKINKNIFNFIKQ